MPFAPCGAPIHRSPTENYTARFFDYLIRWVMREVSAKVFDCFVPKHTQRQKNFHVSIAFFDSRQGLS